MMRSEERRAKSDERFGPRGPLFAFRLSFIAAVAMVIMLFILQRPASAVISGSPCAGNICTEPVVVGGQTVRYAYTEHIRPNGTFKIRIQGVGPYATSTMISYIVHGMPAFSSRSHYKNPAPGHLLMTESSASPGNDAFEIKDTNGCNCLYDQVMTMTYASLAAGSYTFSLSIIQNGSSGGFVNKTFYVDAGAPDTGNESSTLAGITPAFDPPCGDAASGQPIDNNLDYFGNCADVTCNNAPASGADPTLRCEQPEQTCSDDFDNDADGVKDCLDPDCNGRIGRVAPPAYCQTNESLAALSGTTPCNDLFDNDGDGRKDCVDNLSTPAGNPSQTCWKQTAYGCPATETSCTDGIDNDEDKSYDDSVDNWDDFPLTGRDCTDYDCAENDACPDNENKNGAGVEANEQCFNSVDDDLDHAVDCADIDCRGIFHPSDPQLICFEKEFDLAQSYQRCSNGFDDDGDDVTAGDSTDCNDDKVPGGDCKRRFLSCGPCPAREDIAYASCSDAKNNDTDGSMDCADADCAGDIGLPSNAAHCAAPAGETGRDMCSDGFDNDVDAAVDCADANCSGTTLCGTPDCAPAFTYACQASGETGAAACADLADNDADGLRDCADSGCYASPPCDAKTWTNAACQTVPRFSEPTTFTSTDPTVSGQSYLATHVNSTDVIRLIGTGIYSSVTIIIGDNTDPLKYYPYAAGLGFGCNLSGTNASQFGATFTAGHFFQLYNISQPVSGFDLALTCVTPGPPTPGAPAAEKTYPISISVLKAAVPEEVAEYGDADFSTTLYESAAPTMIAVEGEGETGGSVVRVPYGGQRRFRAVPDEPDPAPPGGLDQSGICRCTVDVGGTAYPSATGECITDPIAFTSDATVTVSGFAEDGANNIGASGGARSIDINVIPAVKTALSMTSPSKPYFRSGARQFGLFAEFQTGSPVSFTPTCEVFLRDAATGNVIGGPPGPTFSFAGVNVGSEIRCQGSFDLRNNPVVALPADGEYTVAVRVSDTQGDQAESNRLPVFVCNGMPAFGAPETVCSKADFDYDGSSEALYTTLYSTAPKACDNCIGFANAGQEDGNANGVGDLCEPDDAHGRCEVDRNIVCDCDSDAASCSSGLRCPAPSIGVDALNVHIDPQRCIDSWGLCTVGGTICLELGPGNPADEQCHFCDGDPAIGCSVDQDCIDAGPSAGTTCGTTPATSGKGKCAGDNTVLCRRDSQCIGGGGAYVGPCQNANICENLLFPWLQTKFGNIFSRKNIIAPAEPPQGQFNATYCVTAQGSIANFTSSSCGLAPNAGTPYDVPKAPSYANVFGRVDVPGILAGKYSGGAVIETDQATFLSTFTPGALNGKVWVVSGDLAINAPPITISNASGDNTGNGTVIVRGGNLTINTDITYGGPNPARLDQIGSIAWLVLPVIDQDQSIEKGEIYINKDVHTVVGAFFAGGNEGIYTILPTDTDGPEPLDVFGMMVAKKFHLGRSFKSVSRGSERIIFDGRAVANPPPGLGDITKTLPIFSDTPPQ